MAKARCQAPDLAAMLARYEHGLLNDEERRRLEAHLLECDACFAELERGSLVREALETPGLAAALEPPRKQTILLLRRPEFALLAAALVLFILMLDKPGAPSELLRFPTEVTLTDMPRTGTAGDDLGELIRAGSGHLNLGHYGEAERFLRAARERAPQDPTAAYLLGLVLALKGDPEGAIPHLAAAAEASEDASWVLAIAYLKSGQADRARERLSLIAAGEGSHATDARALIRNTWSN